MVVTIKCETARVRNLEHGYQGSGVTCVTASYRPPVYANCVSTERHYVLGEGRRSPGSSAHSWADSMP